MSIGINRKAVNRLIQRYELIVTNCHNQELIEDLPVSLTYEIAKPSSESTESKKQAKEAVLKGEVKTLKEYKELEAKLRKAEEDNKNLSYELSQEKKNRTVVEKVIDNTPKPFQKALKWPQLVSLDHPVLLLRPLICLLAPRILLLSHHCFQVVALRSFFVLISFHIFYFCTLILFLMCLFVCSQCYQ